MLERVELKFSVVLTSMAHIGSDEIKTEKDQDTIATVCRNHCGIPLLPPTALRGALRQFFYDADKEEIIDFLFGPSEISDIKTGNFSRLWIYGGSTKQERQGASQTKQSNSIIITGIKLDADLKTVENKHLYKTEYLPEGTEFEFEAIFQGSLEAFQKKVLPALNMLSDKEFSVGADKGYGFGRSKLKYSSEVTHHYYDVENHKFAEPKILSFEKPAAIEASPNFEKNKIREQFTYVCEGPYFSQNPESKNVNGRVVVQTIEHAGKPYVSGKSILQALRAKSSWIEAIKSLTGTYDYSAMTLADVDKHARSLDAVLSATCTERLFGMAGWAKTVRIENVIVEHTPNTQYKTQMIKLDTFTQAPIDSALVTFDVPAQLKLSFDLVFDEKRYVPKVNEWKNVFEKDKNHFELLCNKIKNENEPLKIGHAQAAGFGWFTHVGGGK